MENSSWKFSNTENRGEKTEDRRESLWLSVYTLRLSVGFKFSFQTGLLLP